VRRPPPRSLPPRAGLESRWCRFRLLGATSPLCHPTNDSAALPQVAVTGAGGCLRVATVLLRLSLPLSRLRGWAAPREKAPSGWGTCVFGVSVGDSGATGGGTDPSRLRPPRDIWRGRRQGCAALPPPGTFLLPVGGRSRRYGFRLFGATSPFCHPPTTPRRFRRWR